MAADAADAAAPPPDPNESGVFRSEDGGMTWTFMSNQNQRPMYFSQIRVDPVNDQKLFVGGTPGQMSLDGGKTWTGINGSHTDYHAFWINPKDPRQVFTVGHDGGIDVSNDGGSTWDYHNDIASASSIRFRPTCAAPITFAAVCRTITPGADPAPCAPNTGPVNTDWFTVSGGDGFYTRQDPTDWAIVYGESQDGNMTRHDLRAGTQKSIRPSAGRGNSAAAAAGTPAAPHTESSGPDGRLVERNSSGRRNHSLRDAKPRRQRGGRGGGGGGRGGAPNSSMPPDKVDALRFYWNAPIEISPHNPAVIYMAAHIFFKSTNRGDTWRMNPDGSQQECRPLVAGNAHHERGRR